MNKLSNALKCVNCRKALETPVLLPCYHSICQKHSIGLNGLPIFCSRCENDNPIPSNWSFPRNEALADIIEAQIGALNFGKEHNDATQSCHKLDELLTKIEHIIRDPANFTYEAINCLKNVVQLRGEEMKLKIDEQMNELILKLEECKEVSKKALNTCEHTVRSDKLESEKEEARRQLEKWTATLNEIKINEEEWKRIREESKIALESFELKLVQFKIDLLPKRFDELRDEIEKIFGNFEIELEFNLDSFRTKVLGRESTIIRDYNMKAQLFKLCELEMSGHWELLYRGSLHGFRAFDFHAKCDHVPKTLTIIKATSGNIFGGYTETTWDKRSGYKLDRNAFLFSLANSEQRPVRVNVANDREGNAIYCHEMYGPTFGDGRDLKIGDNSNLANSCYSNFCCSYVLKSYISGSQQAKCFLAGSYKFTVEEIEVFKIK